jgi:hypothetical protein
MTPPFAAPAWAAHTAIIGLRLAHPLHAHFFLDHPRHRMLEIHARQHGDGNVRRTRGAYRSIDIFLEERWMEMEFARRNYGRNNFHRKDPLYARHALLLVSVAEPLRYQQVGHSRASDKVACSPSILEYDAVRGQPRACAHRRAASRATRPVVGIMGTFRRFIPSILGRKGFHLQNIECVAQWAFVPSPLPSYRYPILRRDKPPSMRRLKLWCRLWGWNSNHCA